MALHFDAAGFQHGPDATEIFERNVAKGENTHRNFPERQAGRRLLFLGLSHLEVAQAVGVALHAAEQGFGQLLPVVRLLQ